MDIQTHLSSRHVFIAFGTIACSLLGIIYSVFEYSLNNRYINKYGFVPEFRAGLHGGKVLITWIGEVKKEIVYVGDVLNTAARIAEECKKARQDFLLSGDKYDRLDEASAQKCSFYNQLRLRGKEEEVKIYSYPLS